MHWQKKRQEVQTDNRKKNVRLTCDRCCVTKFEDGFEVHHQPLAYQYLFEEPLELLEFLCKHCHQCEHRKKYRHPLDSIIHKVKHFCL